MENDQLTSGEERLAIIHAMINKAKHQLAIMVIFTCYGDG